MQSGDNVESVDMELSDDENDIKQKGRGVLVDVRSQDLDMRGPLSVSDTSHHLDMDMRMIPLPGGCGPQDVRKIHQAPPPPPPPPASQQFHHRPPDFQHDNSMDFRQNEGNFLLETCPPPFSSIRDDFPSNHQNFSSSPDNFSSLQSNFGSNSQNFSSNLPHFHQRDFHSAQDFDYRDSQHERWNKEDSKSHGRFSQYDQSRLDNLHRSDQIDRCGRGRGNRGNRREKLSEDHDKKNSRRQRSHDHVQTSSPAMLPNNNPVLLENTNGEMITGKKEFNDKQEVRKQDFCFPNSRLLEEPQKSDFTGISNCNANSVNQSTSEKSNTQTFTAADSQVCFTYLLNYLLLENVKQFLLCYLIE